MISGGTGARPAASLVRSILILLPVVLIPLSCGGDDNATDGAADGGDPVSETPASVEPAEIRALARQRGLTGAIAGSREQVVPDTDPLVKLGQLLFFSRSLSAAGDVACASCHHPHLAGGDGLSLPVGVAAREPEVLGPGRKLDPLQDKDPRADGGPNVPRNSQTVFNVSLYDRALFHDGRTFVLAEERSPGGQGQPIRTPDSAGPPDPAAGDSLLEAQARFPLVSDNEMRGFHFSGVSHPDDYRALLLDRLRQSNPGPGLSWDVRFAQVFGDSGDGDPLNMANLQKALAAYQESLLFIDSPWRRFLVNDQNQKLSPEVLAGAELFLTSIDEGGLGCVACHAGEKFSNEEFYNVGFPQIGRGKRTNRKDGGRWEVTQDDADEFAFRVPSLLNVEITGPWGHAGTFSTLETLLDWHVHPEAASHDLAPVLLDLEQFRDGNVLQQYGQAQHWTRATLESASFDRARPLLPNRPLARAEKDNLLAFLHSLTDNCAADPACLEPWIPDADEDPDGNLLIRGQPFTPDLANSGQESDYPDHIPLSFPATPDSRTTFADMQNCSAAATGNSAAANTGEPVFIKRDDLGLDASHGFTLDQWIQVGAEHSLFGIQLNMFSGGITATYLPGDCWPDLIFAGGGLSGMTFYRNRGGQQGFTEENFLAEGDGLDYGSHTGAVAVDINGDYRRELLFGNLFAEAVPVLALDATGRYQRIAELPVNRATWGISAADFTGSGYPGFFLAHWAPPNPVGRAPALWANTGGNGLRPIDDESGTGSEYLDTSFNFTPSFVDLNNNGRQDLVIASDFETSVVLENRPGDSGYPRFHDITDRDVITDENGMGATVADFDNDLKPDWFVTSIHDAEGNNLGWSDSGNRLYRNISDRTGIRFEDVTEEAGVREGGWGWASCAADFNNDGYLDIFHVNGFGEIPRADQFVPGVDLDDVDESARLYYDEKTAHKFRNNPPRLWLNNGDGSFREAASDWNIDVPSQGTGVTCFDYDRDGDIDIGLVDNFTGMQFFENQLGASAGHGFVNIRLVGRPPNTEALGARVYITADLGSEHGTETQLRLSQANSSMHSGTLPDLHAGLGQAQKIDRLRVVWPGSVEETVCEDLPVNRFLVLNQNSGSCPPTP